MRWLYVSCALSLCGCESILGADFDGRRRTDELDASVPDAAISDGETDAIAAGDAEGDGRVSTTSIPCGDTRALDMQAPWPTFGYCQTRPGRSPAKAPKKPTIRWRYLLESSGLSDRFYGQPVITRDGTVVLFAAVQTQTFFDAEVIAVRDGKLQWRTGLGQGLVQLSSGFAIGADGAIYTALGSIVVALEPSGKVRWSAPFQSSFESASAPLILPDGSVVVAGGSCLKIYDKDGSITGSACSEDGTFFPSLALTPASQIIALANAKANATQGALYTYSATGQKIARTPFSLNPESGVAIGANSEAIFMSTTSVLEVANGGIVTGQVPAGSLHMDFGHPVLTLDRAWFATEFSYDLKAHTVAKISNHNSGMGVAFGDGLFAFPMRRDPNEESRSMRCIRQDQTEAWTVPLDFTSDDPSAPAIGADGTVYMAWGKTLYAVGDL